MVSEVLGRLVDDLCMMVAAGEYEIGEPESDPRNSLVFFRKTPEAMLDHRNAMAADASFSEWCLVTDRRIGAEEAKDYRWFKVMVIVVDDVGAAEQRLRAASRG